MIRITSPYHYTGRNRPIRLIVLHTAESDCAIGVARAVASYLARPDVGYSCHYSVGPEETVAQVYEADTAWAAAGANADGIQIEQAGRAGFHQSDWAEGLAELMVRTQTVPLVADICQRHQLPAVWLTAADLLAGAAGITDHNTVNQAYGKGDHWDCGPNYPGQMVAAMAARIIAGTPTTDNDQGDDDMTRAFVAPDGRVLLVTGDRARTINGNWPDVQKGLADLASAGVISAHPDGAVHRNLSIQAFALLEVSP